MVAPNVRCGSRQREPEKEMDTNFFTSSVPLNTYLRNPSRLCNWNVEARAATLDPPRTAEPKSWRRTSTTQSSIRSGLV